MLDLRSWLVLGLVIEQPSHGYELSRRYESRFSRLLPMSLPRSYEMLDGLRARGLIEPAKLNGATRQAALRHSFRATAEGIAAYRGWLSSGMASRIALVELEQRAAGAGGQRGAIGARASGVGGSTLGESLAASTRRRPVVAGETGIRVGLVESTPTHGTSPAIDSKQQRPRLRTVCGSDNSARPLESATLASPVSEAIEWREQPEAWMILALLAESPRRGPELSRRYERRIGSFLPLSRPRIGDALEQLRRAGLIELIAPRGSDGRARPLYGVTPKGVKERRRWLTAHMAHDPALMALLGPIASAGLIEAQEIIEVLSAYALKCKREIRALAVNGTTEGASLAELAVMLGDEALVREWEARLQWAADARELIQSQE